MKIYINRESVSGPWGGGNKTVDLLGKKCVELGWEVVYNLKHKDIDIIFCIDPRPNPKGEWYQDFINYKSEKNSSVKIIQRVGDVGTHSKPDLTDLVRQTVQISDFIIFPSDWARKYIAYEKKNYAIVNNRPKTIFYNKRNKSSKIKEKIKILTHHWSMNPKKGFDVYNALANYLSENETKFEFTYIGRYNGEPPEGIKYIPPQDDNALKDLLPKYDIYLTASQEEAGANHVIEAMASGLPVVYRSGGGSIQEYVRNFGIEYEHNLQSLLSSLHYMSENYVIYKQKVLGYNQDISMTMDQYVSIIEHVNKK